MSVPTTLSSRAIPLAFSEDDITYKNAVCLSTAGLNMDVSSSVEETQCGPFNTEGSMTTQFDFEIVVNTTPNVTEISGPDVMDWFVNRTAIYTRVQPGTGMNIKAYGKLYNIKSTLTGGPGLYKISGTFKADGDPILT